MVHPDSSLVGHPVDYDVMRQTLGCCFISSRGIPMQQRDLKPNDVLLLEADSTFVNTEMWVKNFTITRKVPNSTPPRFGSDRDPLRIALTCVGMLALIAIVTFENLGVDLAIGGIILLTLLILSGAQTMDMAYGAIKASVLLTIAGAFGLSLALQTTGIANFASNKIVAVGETTRKSAGDVAGIFAVRAAVYLVAVILSCFMNNSATVAILGPMSVTIADETNQNTKDVLFVIIFAAGTCLTTPLGYQTNLMVMKDGGYSFGDFLKFGFPIQMLHMVLTLGAIMLFNDLLGM